MKIKSFLIIASIGMMFAACSSRDDYSAEAEKIPIRINATIEGHLVGTRAAENPATQNGTSLVNGDWVCLDICYAGEDIVIPSLDSHGNSLCKYNDGKIEIGDDVFFPSDGRSIDVDATYPGKIGTSSPFIIGDLYFSVQKDQSDDTMYRMSDLMYAYDHNVPTGETVSLTFRHMLTKIVVNLKKMEGFDDQYSVKMLGVQTCTEISGYATPTETSESDKRIDDITFGNYAAAGVTAIVIPQTISTGKKLFEITYDNKTYTYTTDSEITFASGSVYTFNLSFDGTTITTGSIDIAPWEGKESTSNIHGGDLVEES